MDRAGLVERLRAELEAYEAASLTCPARRRGFSSAKDCPKCGASAREGCGLDIGAAFRFVHAASSLHAAPPAGSDNRPDVFTGPEVAPSAVTTPGTDVDLEALARASGKDQA